jgi:hypothetical protein
MSGFKDFCEGFIKFYIKAQSFSCGADNSFFHLKKRLGECLVELVEVLQELPPVAGRYHSKNCFDFGLIHWSN